MTKVLGLRWTWLCFGSLCWVDWQGCLRNNGEMSDSQITACKMACHSSTLQTFFAEKEFDEIQFCGFIGYVASIEWRKMCVNLEKQRDASTLQSIKEKCLCVYLSCHVSVLKMKGSENVFVFCWSEWCDFSRTDSWKYTNSSAYAHIDLSFWD